MTIFNTHSIRLATVAFLAAGMLASCGRDDSPSQPLPANSFDIKFAIAVGRESATRGVSEEDGTAAENNIDINDLKILVFDEDKVLHDVIYDCGIMKPSRNELLTGPYLMADKYYYFSVSLNPDYYSKDKKFAIVALANWNGVSDDPRLTRNFGDLSIGAESIGSLTIDDLKNALFSLNPVEIDGNASWTPGEGRWIPMFGSNFCSLEKYDSGVYDRSNPMSLGDINLVRAFAKVEVINNDTTAHAPKIRKVEFAARNVRGRLMQDFDFNSSTSHVSSVSIPEECGLTNKRLLFNQQGNTYTAFLPELELYGISDRRKAICITLGLDDDTTEERWLWLAPYDNVSGRPLNDESSFGDEWRDLRRNYIYRYVVNSLGFDFEISCEAWKYGGKYHIDFEQVN